MITILFPGRHHMLTKFQYNYLRDLIDSGINGEKVERIIFAVTSSDHSNTRRNPVPLYLRVLAIEKFSRDLPCDVKIYPIPDIKQTEKYAEYLIKQINYQGGENLNYKNTVLACSTPPIINLFKKLKFKNFNVELIGKNKYFTLRPYEVIDLLVKSNKKWRGENSWKEYASQATIDVYTEYNLGDIIVECFGDSLLNEDADLTDTRDYNTYAQGMDNAVQFKYKDIKPFLKEGKIVDMGCGTGSLIKLISKDFQESDIIGIEGTRKFYEYCKMQEYPNAFVFFYRKNILDQNFKVNSVDNIIFSSVLHEIYSYINKETLVKVLKNSYHELSPKGRLIIRDVVGVQDKNKIVYMKLNKKDGKDKGDISKLSTYSKFFEFSKDFVRKIKFKKETIDDVDYIVLRFADAYEYMSKMDYTDNWKSEMHEEFGFWNFKEWKENLEKVGFKIVEGSKEFSNPFILEKSYKGKVELYEKVKGQLKLIDYPSTNMILACEKVKAS